MSIDAKPESASISDVNVDEALRPSPRTRVKILFGMAPAMKSLSKFNPELVAILIIILFFLVFFWPATVKGLLFISGDSMAYSLPMRMVAWAEIRRGALPLWTPTLLSGYPLLSMAQLGLGYPLTWFYLILPGHYAEQIYVLAPFALTPIFLYAYLRVVGRSRMASMMGGLSFAYGGLMAGTLSFHGYFSNAVMWTPLLLIAIERARTRPLVPCMVGVAAAFAMSLLTGLGQGSVYAGCVALAYALFLCLFPPPDEMIGDHQKGWGDWRRWKPLIASACGMAAAAGVAAFQILETMQAQRLSVRRELTYEMFSGGALSPREWLLSLLAPIYHFNWEVTSSLPLLAVSLALIAIFSALFGRRERGRILFWFFVALLSALLMMGDHTPLYRLLYHIPVLNLFRVPWRHAFEWTFAASMLAAYGWDALAYRLRIADCGLRIDGWQAVLRKKRAMKTRFSDSTNPQSAIRNPQSVVIGVALLAMSLLVAITLWKLATRTVVPGVNSWPNGLAEKSLIAWKVALTLLLLATVCWAQWKLRGRRMGKVILAAALALACFWEQQLFLSHSLFTVLKPASFFAQTTPPMRFLQERLTGESRVYVSSPAVAVSNSAEIEVANLPAKYGFHNAAGYEPLMSQRYGRAFGSDWGLPDFQTMLDPQILDPRWQTLDLLNVKYLVEFAISTARSVEKDGVRFSPQDNPIGLAPGQTIKLSGTAESVDQLSLVTSLANSADMAQEEPVARVAVLTTDGRKFEHVLKAGVDTAEWAHDRADVLPNIRHDRAPIFDSNPGAGFQAHRYWSRVDLKTKAPIARLEIANVCSRATLTVFKVTAYDSALQDCALLTVEMPDQWRKVYDQSGARIYENPRAAPRAWIVGHAEAVNEQEALRRIRGEDERPFDPRRTALLEIEPERLPPELRETPGDAPNSTEARVVNYSPNRLTIEASADRISALVVSEINYPGWEATIDGQPAPIFTADYLLRAVITPAGKHRVEMRYTAPAARRGAIISALTLLALLGGSIISTRAGAMRILRR